MSYMNFGNEEMIYSMTEFSFFAESQERLSFVVHFFHTRDKVIETKLSIKLLCCINYSVVWMFFRSCIAIKPPVVNVRR